eukprot:scaffold273198_cov22-Tisochrysis_lutea.AAC.2
MGCAWPLGGGQPCCHGWAGQQLRGNHLRTATQKSHTTAVRVISKGYPPVAVNECEPHAGTGRTGLTITSLICLQVSSLFAAKQVVLAPFMRGQPRASRDM